MTNVSTQVPGDVEFLIRTAAAVAYPSGRSWDVWAELLEEEEGIVVGRVLRQNAA